MTITMNYTEYNRMQDFAKQFACKPGAYRPMMEHIKLTITGKTAKAEALDSYKAGEIMLSLSSSEQDGIITVPITTKLKRQDVFAAITQSEKEIEIKTATETRIHRRPEGEFVDSSKFYPAEAPQEVFGFDPKVLADALKAFGGEKSVKLEYHGALKPLIITSGTAKALVMPVRLK